MKLSLILRKTTSAKQALSFVTSGLLVISTCLPAFAVSPPNTLLNASANASQIDATPESANDIVIGKNTKGPYVLSWRQIDPESEIVTIDGFTAQRGSDYTIDYASGTVAFTKPVRSGGIAQVSYRYKLDKATRNTAGLNLPIELGLLQSKTASLRLTGLYKEMNPNQPNSAMTVFGLSGDRKLGVGTQLSSSFMLSSNPDADGPESGHWDRSAFRLGGSHTTGKMQIKTSYEHAGQDFAAAKEYGAKQGMDTTDIAAQYAASDRLLLGISSVRVEDNAGDDKGAGKTMMQQRLAYKISQVSMITATRTTDETRGADGSERILDVNKIEATHSFNPNTTATASVATTTLSNETAKTLSEETTTNIRLQSSDKLQLQGTHTQTNSDALGDSSATKVAVTAKPGSNIKLNADYNQTSSEILGDYLSSGVSIEAKPADQLRLQMSYRDQESSLLGSETARSVRLEAQPISRINLSAAITERLTSSQDDVTKEARMQIQPGNWLTMSGGFQLREAGSETSTITDVNASIRPVKFISLSGGYKDREMVDQADSLDTTTVNVALDTTKYLKITGSYQKNPEDITTGQPLTIDARTVGVQTTVAGLDMTGGLTRKNDYYLGSLTSEKQFGLGMRLFGVGRLTGGYKLAESSFGSEMRTETYSLGYTHRVSSGFNLLLSGRMTKSEMDQMSISGRPDYEAEAKVGIKF